jgi:hypothetical protein
MAGFSSRFATHLVHMGLGNAKGYPPLTVQGKCMVRVGRPQCLGKGSSPRRAQCPVELSRNSPLLPREETHKYFLFAQLRIWTMLEQFNKLMVLQYVR